MKKKNLFNANVFFIGFAFVLLFGFSKSLKAQEKELQVSCVAFYNIENLFDTIDSPDTNDAEFTPTGTKVWTWEKYQKKLSNMADVISQIGDEYIKGGPAIIGLAEVENRGVLEDLLKTPQLKNSNYKIVHYDSPDKRGIDVALLYRSDAFVMTNSRPIKFSIPDEINPFEDDFYSRDFLLVSGLLNGDEFHVIVNHWPSRRGGSSSEPLRNEAAKNSRSICDSILKLNPNAKIAVVGDLNDDPTNESLVKYMNAKGNIEKLQPGEFYNTMYKNYKTGIGTTAYRDAWSLFDQIVISQGLTNPKEGTTKFWKAEVFNRKFLLTKSGKYKGYPYRTFDFDLFQNGYSDHFPVYMFLTTEKKSDKDFDGVADKDDKCPEVKGYLKFNGCPDSDNDGIQDSEDKCPNIKGIAKFAGCPDTDNDGIQDSEDKCPNEKGLVALNGCPDKDGDGIADKDDKCPEIFGIKENKGCPEVKEETKKIFEQALTGIQFEKGKDIIKISSNKILDEVVKIMQENASYKLEINGHTDNKGDAVKNKELSQKRADAVKKYITTKGISENRMTANGFGDTQPIADNKTEEGKAKNRRVEFKVIF